MVCKLQEKFKTKAACFSCHFGVASRISSYTLGCDPFKTEKKTPRKNFIWVWLYDMKETEQPFKIRNALPFSITTAFFLRFKLERPFTDLLLGEGGFFHFKYFVIYNFIPSKKLFIITRKETHVLFFLKNLRSSNRFLNNQIHGLTRMHNPISCFLDHDLSPKTTWTHSSCFLSQSQNHNITKSWLTLHSTACFNI